MRPRFHVPAAGETNAIVELPAEEAAHLARVLRLAPGDAVRVFNGRGQEWIATVEEAGKARATVRLGERVAAAEEPRVRLTLALAVLKGDKMDDVIRDAVMLGVAAVQPFTCARTEVPAAALTRGHRLARWQRIAVSSAKQCGRAVVPEVRPVLALADVWSSASPVVMLVEPGAHRTVRRLDQLPPAAAMTLVVGPEGGWTDEELHAGAAEGAMLLTLGRQTLRADAVPIVALTAVRVRIGDF